MELVIYLLVYCNDNNDAIGLIFDSIGVYLMLFVALLLAAIETLIETINTVNILCGKRYKLC